ncbi:unnamed protein product, partial [Meganyctiphanes norvegica]
MDTTIFDLEPSLDCDADLMTALGDFDEQFLNELNLYDPYCMDFTPQEKSGLLAEMEAFQRIPVSEWQGEHCVDWAVAVCRSRGLQELAVDVSSLGHITGYHLLRYTVQDFATILGEPYGSVFYKELQKMEKVGNITYGFEDVVDLSSTGPHASLNQQNYYYSPESPEQALNLTINSTIPTEYHSDYPHDYSRESPSVDYNRESPSVDYYSDYHSDQISSGYQSDYQMECHSDGEDYYVLQNMNPVEMSELGNMTQYYRIDEVSRVSPHYTPVIVRQEVHQIEEVIQQTGPHEVPQVGHVKDATKMKARASRNEQVTIENSELVDDFCKKISTTSRARERGPKNWEFLIRLLLDPRANPKLIRWEDEAKGTFRLVRPEIITSMWNAKSPKKLSYDNFARGLRYHYKTGALFKVGDRQLVYGCGPKAVELINQIRREQF